MRRFLLWILMVILMVGLILGGSLGFLYFRIGESDLPAEQAALGQISLEPNGYDWDMPILGGIIHKNYASSPSLGAQDLGVVSQLGAALHLPAWATDAQIELEFDGQTVYSGNAAGYASFAWPADGNYRISIQAIAQDLTARPTPPTGWYSYSAKFNLQRDLSAILSANKLPQGGVFAIYVQGSSTEQAPTAQCDLGRVWFAPYASGWIGFLPSAYNAESGIYPVQISVGDRTLTLEVEVTFREFGKAIAPGGEPESEEAALEYRNRIWPLYTEGSPEKRWSSSFVQPIQGSILLDYGAYVYESESDAHPGRTGSVTFSAPEGSDVICPADGRVVFSGPLLLTGNTLVVEHGCGVKSYFYHLNTLLAQEGSTLQQGQTLGLAGAEPVIYELKIGNKSIDPWAAWKGSSGLFYTPDFGA